MRATMRRRARRRTALIATLLAAPLLAAGLIATPAAAHVTPPAAVATPAQSFIVRAVPGSLPAVTARVAELQGRVTGHLLLINAVVGELSANAVAALRSDSRVAEITANGGVQLLGAGVRIGDASSKRLPAGYDPESDRNSMFNMQHQVGIRALWSAGYTGAGIDVAVLDSGVAPVAGLSAPGKVINGPDLTPESQDPETRYLDTYGHGTHMAGIIAGRDTGVDPVASINDPQPFLGVAPGARILSVKVADARGNTDVSQVIAGISWIVQHARDPGLNVRVLNLSFGTDSAQSYLTDPLAFAAEMAWHKGIVVVVAAGNGGAAHVRLTNPAIDPYLISVGAGSTQGTVSTYDDTIADFSSRGNVWRHPDIVAPGTHLQSLRVPGSYIDQTTAVGPGGVDARFFRGSGSSQAAAVASGVAALILQAHPTLTPDSIKYVLKKLALNVGLAKRERGNGTLGDGSLTGHKALNYDSPASVTQKHARATGLGSLELARGGSHLTIDGTPLIGEKDIFGKPFHAWYMALLQAYGVSWNGGTWNGSLWTGANMDVGGWNSVEWTGRNWAGSSWTGRNWASGHWTGRNWAGSNWDDDSWEGFK